MGETVANFMSGPDSQKVSFRKKLRSNRHITELLNNSYCNNGCYLYIIIHESFWIYKILVDKLDVHVLVVANMYLAVENISFLAMSFSLSFS